MRKFCCRDAGVDCDWTVFATDENEIVRRARDHDEIAHRQHPLRDDEERIREAIKAV